MILKLIPQLSKGILITNVIWMLKKKTEKLKTEARKLVVPDVFDNMKGLLQPPPHPWETAHLPLP